MTTQRRSMETWVRRYAGTTVPWCAAAVLLLAALGSACAPPLRQVPVPQGTPVPVLWEPTDVAAQDTYFGPWGAARAPDPADRYTLESLKHTGVNPGMTVRDRRDRKWNVKQAPTTGYAPEGPIEVTVSRILSAIGYKQPPIYYLDAFLVTDDWGTHFEGGGRFRLSDETLKDRGVWSWHQNPFVGTPAYRGLLVVLLMFNESDLKASNNTLYEHRDRRRERWFVVRDIGTALGSTGRFAPRRGDPDAFDSEPFIVGVSEGFVRFGYRGRHQELVRETIRPRDVVWAGELLGRLSQAQWREAFRAGGFAPAAADRYIRRLQQKVADARALRAIDQGGR